MRTFLKSILTIFLIGVPFVSFAWQQGFVQVDEGRLYYEEQGQGVPIIVLHGGPGLDQGYLKPQLLQLAANHRLIFYDQRGSGRSLDTKIDEKHINIHQFVEDLELLRKSLCLDQFVLMGHSWGGLLAMEYAMVHQDHLMGLILVSTAPADYKGSKAFMDGFEVQSKHLHNDLKPFFTYEDFEKLDAAQIETLYRKLFSVYFYNPNEVKDLTLNFGVESARKGFKVLEELTKTYYCQASTDLFPHLKSLTVPTFILHGKQDIIPVWAAEEIKEAISQSEIAVLDHCGHFPYIEQPSQFFTELNKFLLKITKAIRCNL